MKLALKRGEFCDVTDIIKNVMEELKRLSKYGFQECFLYIRSHLQKCIFARETYFEGNIASMIAPLCILQE
jgi:hypothetical protein